MRVAAFLTGRAAHGRKSLVALIDAVRHRGDRNERERGALSNLVAGPESSDALYAFVALARFHGVSAEPEQVLHRMGTAHFGITELLRAAKVFGMKARLAPSEFSRLHHVPMPCLAVMRDGRVLILGKCTESGVLGQWPTADRPHLFEQAEFKAAWNGHLILITKSVKLTDLRRHFDITWFIGAIGKYRSHFFEVLLASFMLQVFGLVSPLFFQVIIDKVLVHRGLSTLDMLILALLIISIFEVVIGGFRTYLFAHTTNRVDVELGARLFHHLLALPLNYFQARRAGDSVARVRELENIRNFITGSALTLVLDLLFAILFIIIMFFYSGLLTWIVIGAFPFYILMSAGLTPLFRRRLEEKFDKGAENQAFLVEAISGVETVKAMAVEPQMQRRWEEQIAEYVAASFRVTSLANIANQSVQLVSKIVLAATLYFGAKLVIDGRLSVGELVAFNLFAGRVSAPVLRLAQTWQDFQQARISVARLGDILNTIAEPTYSAGRTVLSTISGAVRFENVSFRYRLDGNKVLDAVSFSIEPGQVIGIVGSSGSGKSTLAKLIQRLQVPESGRVLVDGVDLAIMDLPWLRRRIGIVLQDNILFNQSVRDNVALADPSISMERVIAASMLAGAHDFISELPESYDTIVGEKGSSLSGGQKQRIAIARALVGDPRIMIFDEATSALDYESERIIQDNMKNIAQGRTTIIIAHRLSTVRNADRIITLENGRIVEDGSHDELIQRGGRYANLYKMQSNES